MSVSYWTHSINEHQNIQSDVTIIGGGISGVSISYWLSKLDPELKITLVDKGSLGSGATGRNAGFITCGSVEHFNRLSNTHGLDDALFLWKFSEENLSLLKEHIVEDDQESLDFAHSGSFSLASTTEEFDELKESARIMRGNGISVEELDEAAIKKRLMAEHFVGGIKYLGDASVHPLKLTQKIFQKAIDFNPHITFLENSEVFDIQVTGDSRRVLTNKAHIESPMVVMATNGYSSLLSNYFDNKIFPTKGQILTTTPLPKMVMEGPCYANFVLDYFRQLPTGEVLIGGFRQLEKDTERGFSDETTAPIQEALESFVKKHLPFARSQTVNHRWSGIMGFSFDGNPIVGSLPTDPQIYFMGGFTAHGLGMSFHLAKVLGELIYQQKEIPKVFSAKRI